MICQKHLFSLPDTVHYLNCATMSPLSKAVEAAGIAGVLRKSQPHEITSDHFFDTLEIVKSRFAQLINCNDPHCIALMPSVSYGLAVVAKNIARKCDMQRKRKIILVNDEFPSDVYAWDELVQLHGAQIETIQAPTEVGNRGVKWNEQLIKAIDEHTLLVCLSPTHWADGTLFDLEALRDKCQQHGVLFIIDATQHVGAYHFDVSKIRPDFLICATYKWLLGPYGNALAYLSDFFDDGSPLEQTWIARKDSDDFKSLSNYQTEYRPQAYRYNMGELSQFIHLPMIAAGLEHLLTWTPQAIQQYAQTLADTIVPDLRAAGYWVENEQDRAAHLFGIKLPSQVRLSSLQSKLLTNKVYVSYRGETIRVSINVWNDKNDVEALREVLVKEC